MSRTKEMNSKRNLNRYVRRESKQQIVHLPNRNWRLFVWYSFIVVPCAINEKKPVGSRQEQIGIAAKRTNR